MFLIREVFVESICVDQSIQNLDLSRGLVFLYTIIGQLFILGTEYFRINPEHCSPAD